MPTYVVMVRKNKKIDNSNKCRKIKLLQPSAYDAELEVRKQLENDEDILDISMSCGNETDLPVGRIKGGYRRKRKPSVS